MQKILAGIALLGFLAGTALSQEMDLVQIHTRQGTLKVEGDLRWNTLTVRVRPLTPNHLQTVSEAQLFQLIEKLTTERDSILRAQRFSSLFLGRVVEYPWLETFLIRQAAESPQWQADRAKLVNASKQINAWVADLLFKYPFWAKVVPLFKKSGYRLSGISVEKVLVKDVAKIDLEAAQNLKGKYPFDAMIWLILEKIQ